MRLFVTGLSGHIGSALVPELLAAGHEVVGLARSDASAAKLKAAGAEVWRGDLDDIDGLREAAKATDGVIHLAYKNDLVFSGAPDGFVRAADHDLRVTQAIGDVLAGSNKPFVTTGGTLVLVLGGTVRGRAGTEQDTVDGGPRVDAENLVVALAQRGVRSSSVRLAPSVHSPPRNGGLVEPLIEVARKAGFSAYVGDGATRWPAVHTRDAARLFRLAVEAAPAGSRLHGVAEEGVPLRAIAEAVGRGLGVPTKSITAEDAVKHFGGFLATVVQLDNLTSSAHTRSLLKWEPAHASLLADLAERSFFATTTTT